MPLLIYSDDIKTMIHDKTKRKNGFMYVTLFIETFLHSKKSSRKLGECGWKKLQKMKKSMHINMHTKIKNGKVK